MVKDRSTLLVLNSQTYTWNTDVIFVPDVYILNSHLDVVEKFCEERRDKALAFCAIFGTFNVVEFTVIV